MSERGLAQCGECHGSGQRVTGYTSAGGKVTAPCRPCNGSGFMPTMGGRVVSWRTAYGILDREQSATPVVPKTEQGTLL